MILAQVYSKDRGKLSIKRQSIQKILYFFFQINICLVTNLQIVTSNLRELSPTEVYPSI